MKLLQFASVTEGSGPSLLERRDKSTSVTIQAQTIGRPVGDVATEWEGIFSTMKRPTGVDYVWGGDMENQAEGFGTLGIALLAAIILVYLVMVALYDSFVYPFVVLFSVPLSFIGALWALALTNNSMNIFTILGIIITVVLAALFTALQGYEYYEAPFTMADGAYGSTFFMATGFHGLHVIIGTLFISVAFFRILSYHLTDHHHLGFESSILY